MSESKSSAKRSRPAGEEGDAKRSKGLTKTLRTQVALFDSLVSDGRFVLDSAAQAASSEVQRVFREAYQAKVPTGRVTLFGKKEALQEVIDKHGIRFTSSGEGDFFVGLRTVSAAGEEERKDASDADDIASALSDLADDSEQFHVSGIELGHMRRHVAIAKAITTSPSEANQATFLVHKDVFAIFVRDVAATVSAFSLLSCKGIVDDTIRWSDEAGPPPPFTVPFMLASSVEGAERPPRPGPEVPSEALCFGVGPVRKALDAMPQCGVADDQVISASMRSVGDTASMSFKVEGHDRFNNLSQMFTIMGSSMRDIPRMHPGSARFLTVSVPFDDWKQVIGACANMNSSHVYVDASVARVGGKQVVSIHMSSLAVPDGQVKSVLTSDSLDDAVALFTSDSEPVQVSLDRRPVEESAGAVEKNFSATTLYSVDALRQGANAIFAKSETMTLVIPEEHSTGGAPFVSIVMASLGKGGLVQAVSVASSNKDVIEAKRQALLGNEA